MEVVMEGWSNSRAHAAPYRNGGSSYDDILRRWIAASAFVGLCGVALFGIGALALLVISVLSAVAGDALVRYALKRPVAGGTTQAILIGLLFGLTLPPITEWYVAVVGAVVAMIVRDLSSTWGRMLWHPALVGRVFVHVVFLNSFSIRGDLIDLPVLTPGHLVFGNIDNVQEIPRAEYLGWRESTRLTARHAVVLERPLQTLRRFTDGRLHSADSLVFSSLIRDSLPPWEDFILGTTPGGIGETCLLGLIVAGIYLIYRGYLRWQLPVAVLASAAFAAAVLPIQPDGPQAGYQWFPGLVFEQGRAVGLAYVFTHLAAGPLLLAALLLAGDTVLTPMRTKGQVFFAVGVGVITIFLSLYAPLEGACYWAILIMNTLTPAIDRRTRRSVLGLGPEGVD